MPGPRNQKKKKQRSKHVGLKPPELSRPSSQPDTEAYLQPITSRTVQPPTVDQATPTLLERQSLLALTTDSLYSTSSTRGEPSLEDHAELATIPHCLPAPEPSDQHFEQPIPPSLLKKPFLYDPGDGLRVKDTRAFLASSFAAPPSLDDPMCAEFAEEAILQMLCTVLPEETALSMWYNKSRQTARICPACHRLYRLGDVLAEHLVDGDSRETKETRSSPHLAREQEISGLCSPVCFILAAYNYPSAIRSTWGRMAEELDDATWDLLDGPGQQSNDMGLGMLLKMTRCHDLGLGQLFFPELDMDSDSTCYEPASEREGHEKGRTAGMPTHEQVVTLGDVPRAYR